MYDEFSLIVKVTLKSGCTFIPDIERRCKIIKQFNNRIVADPVVLWDQFKSNYCYSSFNINCPFVSHEIPKDTNAIVSRIIVGLINPIRSWTTGMLSIGIPITETAIVIPHIL